MNEGRSRRSTFGAAQRVSPHRPFAFDTRQPWVRVWGLGFGVEGFLGEEGLHGSDLSLTIEGRHVLVGSRLNPQPSTLNPKT